MSTSTSPVKPVGVCRSPPSSLISNFKTNYDFSNYSLLGLVYSDRIHWVFCLTVLIMELGSMNFVLKFLANIAIM